MKLSKEAFKRLQKAWYKRLEEEGFSDAEKFRGNCIILTDMDQARASNCYRNNTELEVKAKENYYLSIYQYVQDENTIFRNEIDKYILIRHADGMHIKEIADELLQKGTPRERTTIRYTIRKYEMAWGLKYYTLKQLKIKKHG